MKKKERSPGVAVMRIEPTSGWVPLKLGQIWEYQELVYFLIWRDVKVRYKQTMLGVLWAIIQPVVTMLVFSIFFGRLAKMPSDGIPYPLFSFAALVPWTLFTNGLTHASSSLVAAQSLLKRVYFPRMVVPLASLCSGVIDFLIAFALLLVLMAYYGIAPTVNMVWIPAFLLLLFMTSLGVSLWLSALNVQYRDVRYAVPFLTQFWMFATPIAYPSSLLSEPWRTLYGLNPMTGVVEGFRWALLGTATQPGPIIAASASVALILLISGAYYFRRMERQFADMI